jgi:neutral ceramidase
LSGNEFLAGAAEVVINPPTGAPLLGTIQRSDGVHDDLFARALVLSSGTERVAFVSYDLIGMDFGFADEIREAIRRRTGISVALLNCSHTHSSPFTIPWSVLGPRWLSGPGGAWRAEIVRATAELVARAEKLAGPCTLHAGRSKVQVGSNRRVETDQGVVMKPNPAGSVVPWVDVLRIDGPKGNPITVLFSHAAHPVIIHGASKLVSADYPGFAASALKAKLGGEVIPLFAQACGGDINADPLRGGFAEAERAGTALAEAVYVALSKSEEVRGAVLSTKSLKTHLPLQPLPKHEECLRLLKNAEDRLKKRCGRTELSDTELWDIQDEVPPPESQSESTEADDVQPMENQPWWLRDNVLCLRDLLMKIEQGDDAPLRFDAHLLRIGDSWSLLAASHELFSEYQLWADKNLPTMHKMVLAYTNGCESYIPTDRALALGGYEAATFPSLDGAAFKYKHRRALRPGNEQQVIEKLTSLWT